MAVARLDTADSDGGNSSDPSGNYTVSSGSDRGLIVTIFWELEGISDFSAVAFGGQSLTEIGSIYSADSGFRNGVDMWYILDAGITAASGNAIVTTVDNSPVRWVMSYASYTGVNQTGGATTVTDVTLVETNESTPNPMILDVTESSDGLVVGGAVESAATSCTWNAAMAEQIDVTQANSITGSYADRLSTTDANVDVEPTWASQVRAAGIGAALAAAAAPTGSEGPLVGGRLSRGGVLLNSGVLLGRSWARELAFARRAMARGELIDGVMLHSGLELEKAA